MEKQTMRKNSFLALLLLGLVTNALAQQHPNQGRGFDPNGVFSTSGIDHINVFNGSLSITIPLGPSYPVNAGLSYQLGLRYAGNVWDYEDTQCQENGVWVDKVLALPNRRSNAGMGWYVSLGRLILVGNVSNEDGRLQYEGPDGSDHTFFQNLHGDGTTEVNNVWYTRDGTYLRLTKKTTANPNYYELEFPNGQRHKFRDSDGLLEEITDRYGNYVRIAYVIVNGVMDRWTITDGTTAGVRRTHVVEFKPASQSGYYGSVVDYIDLATFNSGTPARYTFNYTTQSITRGHGHDAMCEGADVSVILLSSVVLPDGSTYAATITTTGSGRGHLNTLTLPTLGKLEYTHVLLQFPASGRFKNYRQHSIGVTVKKTLNENGAVTGTWDYTHTLTSEPICPPNNNPSLQRELKKVITDPAGHKTTHYFSVYTIEDWCPNTTQPLWSEYEYGMPITKKVTDPLGGTRFLSTETRDSSGILKRQTYVRYERDLTSEPGKQENTNRRLASQRTVFVDDNNRYSETNYTNFDGLGHYRQTKTEGNQESYATELDPGYLAEGNRRTEFTNFNPEYDANGKKLGLFFPAETPWILDTFDYQQQTERDWVSAPAGPDVTARQEFCYDANGYLRRTRKLSTTTQQDSDLMTILTPDSFGNTVREEYFGGGWPRNTIPATVPYSSAWCSSTPTHDNFTYRIDHEYENGGLKGSWYVTVTGTWSPSQTGTRQPFRTVDTDIDLNTGLVKTSRSAAQYSTTGTLLSSGVVTNYEYDNMARLTWVKPSTTPIANGAWTNYIYTRAMTPAALAQIDIVRKKNGGTGDLTKSQILYDAFGRVRQEKQLLPNASASWNRRQTTYNALGQKATTSELVSDSTPPNPLPVTTFAYDFAGRPLTITPPDCASHATTMNYIGSRFISRSVNVGTVAGTLCGSGESAATTQEHYDRQGRLWKLVEPNGVVTKYAYDIGNRLQRVNMNGQLRTFTYDRRGLLLNERHPEIGSPSFPDIVYSDYDSRGRYGRRRVGVSGGKFDLTYAYDRAERMTSIKETTVQAGHGASGNLTTPGLLKEYTYWGDNSGSDMRVGKVSTARRINWIDRFQAVADVKETYNYAGRDGRPSRRVTESVDWFTWQGITSTKTFSQDFVWNDLGDPAELRYPQCSSPINYADGRSLTCPASPLTIALPDHITNPTSPAYRNGTMVAVPGYGTLSYHPNMLVSQIALTGGFTQTIENDPYSMRRPRRISTVGWSPNFDSGYYAYDGAGNIRAIGADTYIYDTNSRLTQGTFATGSAQSLSYDAFGNIQSMIVNGETRTLTTSSATNRLSIGGVSYDDAGNQLLYGSYGYYHDSLNMLNGLTGPATDKVFTYTADEERLVVYNNSTGQSEWRVRDLGNKVMREYTEGSQSWHVSAGFIHRQDGLPFVQLGFFNNALPLALDHLGSIRRFGSSQHTYSYHPFGEYAYPETAGFTQQLQFTAHEREDPSGGDINAVDYMHARSYFPIVGRFLSVDPGGFNLRKPQIWNRYAYVENNPMNRIDPDGRESAQIRVDAEVDAELEHGLSPSWTDPTMQKGAMIATMVLSPVDEGVLIGRALGVIGRSVARLFGKTDDVVSVSKASRYDDITQGRSVENRATNVSRADFGKNLESQGFTKSTSKDGKSTVYEKDGVKYAVRDASKSGGPTAEVFKDGKLVKKIRLERDPK